DAYSAVKTALARRGLGGGMTPAGGDFGRGISELETAKAGQLSSGLRSLSLANMQQALQNRQGAISFLGSAAGMSNPSPFVSSATSALGDYTAASQGGFLNALKTSLGKGI